MFVLELNLYHSEVAVVLDALRIPSLIGMPENAFTMPDAKARRAQLEEGVSHLVAHHLATKSRDGTVALDEDLVAIIKVAADGEYAAVIVKEVTGLGKQIFVQAATHNAVVEHTRPGEDTHRIAVLESRASLRSRWAEILPVPAASTHHTGVLKCELKTFELAVAQVKEGQLTPARRTLHEQSTNAEAVGQLVEAMAHPVYSANIAMIRREKGLIMDARNFMVLIGGQTSWLISQTTPGASTIAIRQLSAGMVGNFSQQQWDDLCRSKKAA